MNRYRYRLDGYETDWVTTDSAHRVPPTQPAAGATIN